MNPPAILMHYDNRRELVGKVGARSARLLAGRIGYDFCLRTTPEFKDPWMEKVSHICDELPCRPRVLYLDCDSVCFPAPPEDVDALFENEVNVGLDTNGLCVGCIAAKSTHDALRFFGVWRDLGICNDASPLHDQATFRLLYRHFRWISNLVGIISNTLISNPSSGERKGSVCHLEWTRCYDQAEVAKRLEALAARAWEAWRE